MLSLCNARHWLRKHQQERSHTYTYLYRAPSWRFPVKTNSSIRARPSVYQPPGNTTATWPRGGYSNEEVQVWFPEFRIKLTAEFCECPAVFSLYQDSGRSYKLVLDLVKDLVGQRSCTGLVLDMGPLPRPWDTWPGRNSGRERSCYHGHGRTI